MAATTSPSVSAAERLTVEVDVVAVGDVDFAQRAKPLPAAEAADQRVAQAADQPPAGDRAAGRGRGQAQVRGRGPPPTLVTANVPLPVVRSVSSQSIAVGRNRGRTCRVGGVERFEHFADRRGIAQINTERRAVGQRDGRGRCRPQLDAVAVVERTKACVATLSERMSSPVAVVRGDVDAAQPKVGRRGAACRLPARGGCRCRRCCRQVATRSPSAEAVTSIVVFSLIARSTSSTVRAVRRSMFAALPARSVMRIVPARHALAAVELGERDALVDETAEAER